MKHVNFLFIYEVKAREFDNICMLAAELENRGYTTAFINSFAAMDNMNLINEYSCDICIISAGYNTGTVLYFTAHAVKFNNVVNLQWEQFMKSDSAFIKDNLWYFNGLAHNVFHVSWGKWNEKRLTEFCGIPKEKVLTSGYLNFDYYRPKLNSTIIDKKQLMEEFDLLKYEEVCLFISSFALINLPQNILSDVKKAINVSEHMPFSVNSQKEILNWFVRFLQKNKNKAIIYRPHPAEKENPVILNLAEKYENFYVIDKYSIKHWIYNIDVIYSWLTSAAGEVWNAGKSCYILRPIPYKKGEDLIYYENAEFVKTYSEFENTFNKKQYFPIADEEMKFYYSADETPAYVKLCNELERILKLEPDIKLQEMHKLERKRLHKQRTIENGLYGKTMDFLAIKTNLPFNNLQSRRKTYNDRKNGHVIDDYTKQMINKNCATDAEFKQMILKLRNLIKIDDK